MLSLHSCGTFEQRQRGTNEPVAVWCAPDVDIVKSFRHFVGLLCNGPDDEDDYEIKILKLSKQINHSFFFPDVDDQATAKKSNIYCSSNSFTAIFSCYY